MKMTIESQKDIDFLQGKFILQIDSKEPDTTLMDFRWEFAREKRLYFIAGYCFINLDGYIKEYNNYAQFKNIFNKYLYPHNIAEQLQDGGRFHRILTTKELEYLFQKIKEENY